MNISLNLKKEDTQKITTEIELARYIMERGNDTGKMSEADRAKMEARINAKLQSGKSFHRRRWTI